MLSEWEEALEVSVNKPLVKARERWEMFGEERDAQTIQKLEDRGQILSQKIGKIRSFNRDAGDLWACSGYRVHPQTKYGLDWALVRLPDNREIPNLVSLLSVFILIS
jgi:hypothetical protein